MRAMLVTLMLQFPLLRIAVRRSKKAAQRLLFRLRTGFPKVDSKTIVFSAYGGQRYACSPKAIYEYMRAQPKFRGYHFVWLFQDPEQYRFLEDSCTSVCAYASCMSDYWVAHAKYWVFNSMLPDAWSPRRSQVYVQCWHGTPLKKLGLDLEHSENAMNSIREIHDRYRENTKKLDYFLSPSPFASSAFSSAWGLDYAGKTDALLELGYPRNDFLLTYTSADLEDIRRKLNLTGCTKHILLYAPTWRDDQYDPEKGYTYDCPVDFDYLQQALADSCIILFRAHYLVADHFDFSRYDGFVRNVSDVDDINALYVISDLLITDYSSVFFDYANLRRPMIFYMYDMEAYRSHLHAFYLEPDSLPGEIVQDEDALVSAIQRGLKCGEDVRADAFRAKFCPKDDGEAAKRVVEVLING